MEWGVWYDNNKSVYNKIKGGFMSGAAARTGN